MNDFGKRLHEARKSKRLTLRKLGEYVGLSVGYLSDIEHNRKQPPKLDVVEKMEEALGIFDGSLVKLASVLRRKIPKNISTHLMLKPKLSEVLCRVDEDFEDDEVDEVLEFIKQLKKRKS